LVKVCFVFAFEKHAITIKNIYYISISPFDNLVLENLIIWEFSENYLQLLGMQHNYCRCSGPRLMLKSIRPNLKSIGAEKSDSENYL